MSVEATEKGPEVEVEVVDVIDFRVDTLTTCVLSIHNLNPSALCK